jgi:hypothetical protein
MSASPRLNPRAPVPPVRVALPPSLRRQAEPANQHSTSNESLHSQHSSHLAAAEAEAEAEAEGEGEASAQAPLLPAPASAHLPPSLPASLPAPASKGRPTVRPSAWKPIHATPPPPSRGDWYSSSAAAQANRRAAAREAASQHEPAEASSASGYLRLGESVADSQYGSLNADGDANQPEEHEAEAKTPCRWRLWLLVFLFVSTVAVLVGHFVVIPFMIRKIVAGAPVTISTIDLRNAKANDIDIMATGTIVAGGGALNLIADIPAFTANVLYKGARLFCFSTH